MSADLSRPAALNIPQVVRTVAAGSTSPVLVTRSDARIVFANEAAERLLRCSTATLADAHVDTYLLGAAEVVRIAFARRFSLVVDTTDASWTGNRPLLSRAGAVGPQVDVRVSTVTGEDDSYACISIHAGPETQTQAAGAELAGRAEVEAALDPGGTHPGSGVIVIDVDCFDLVNESLGRACGDQLLSQVSDVLRGLTENDELVARLDGDRFALLVEADRLATRTRAEQVLEAIRTRRWRVGGSVVRLTASAGCSAEPLVSRGEERVLGAETALRHAKEAGRDRVVVHEQAGRERARTTIGWTDRIRTDIENGALVPHFQPILDLRNGAVSHYELLARMRADDGRLIQPNTFIPVAERLGMIGMIDRWAIETAIDVLARSPRGPAGPRIAVNASGRSVGSQQLLDCLHRGLDHHRVDPCRLTVEVTETAAIGSIDAAAAFGDELRRLGVGFALDDFGAGFGNFYYLKHLPLDQVKIDGEFIRSIARSASDQLFVEALVNMAEGLRITTVAEFVTDAEALGVVRRLGIDYAQGFHIGMPAPLEAAVDPA